MLKKPHKTPTDGYIGQLARRAASRTEAMADRAVLTLLLKCLINEKHSDMFSYSFHAYNEDPNRCVSGFVLSY